MEATMSSIQYLKTHRTWEDWIAMLIGVVIGLSPWIAGGSYSPVVIWNALLIGVLVLGLAQLEYVTLQRWEEILGIACGLWLVASPSILGYADAGTLRFWHFGLGAVVAALSVMELWQDWRLTEKELSRHGE
jgi:ABC-type branched-subunit amino acid transport system permease subunit